MALLQVTNENDDNCSICYDKKDNGFAVLPCKHSFCLSCIIQHADIKQNCPLCRNEFNINIRKKLELVPIKDDLFSDFLIYSKKLKTYKYKGELIDFKTFLKIQFDEYKKEKVESILETTLQGIDRLLEVNKLLMNEYYIQQNTN